MAVLMFSRSIGETGPFLSSMPDMTSGTNPLRSSKSGCSFSIYARCITAGCTFRSRDLSPVGKIIAFQTKILRDIAPETSADQIQIQLEIDLICHAGMHNDYNMHPSEYTPPSPRDLNETRSIFATRYCPIAGGYSQAS